MGITQICSKSCHTVVSAYFKVSSYCLLLQRCTACAQRDLAVKLPHTVQHSADNINQRWWDTISQGCIQEGGGGRGVRGLSVCTPPPPPPLHIPKMRCTGECVGQTETLVKYNFQGNNCPEMQRPAPITVSSPLCLSLDTAMEDVMSEPYSAGI